MKYCEAVRLKEEGPERTKKTFSFLLKVNPLGNVGVLLPGYSLGRKGL